MERHSSSELDAALDSPFFRSSPDGMVVVDRQGMIVAANPQITDILGYSPHEIVDRLVEELVPDSARQVHRSHRNMYTSNPHPRPMGAGLRLSALHRDGHEVPVDIALSPLQAGDTYYTIAAIRDASTRLEAEAVLSEADEWRAIVDDRQRIARDLHDTVIQGIFAAGMGLQAMQRQMPEDTARKQLGDSIAHLDSVITRLRKVIFNLTHGDGQESLERAVDRVVAEATHDSDINVKVSLEVHDSQLPARVHEHLLATLQEALSNVVRHAKAGRAAVLVKTESTVLCLCVIDDGIGIPEAGARLGFGLTNMINRAQVLGGSCDITAPEKGGTMVEWKVPL